MGVNAIEIYRKNSVSLECTVSGLANLSGYTCTMTVKEHRDDDEEDILLEKEGTANGLVITFSLTDDDMDIAHNTYHYDIVIDNGTNRYTLIQDYMKIMEAVSVP